jgi:hypothetical protein
LEVLDVGRLFHDVLTGQVITRLLENMNHHLRNGVPVSGVAIVWADFGRVFFDQRFEVFHGRVIVPAGIGTFFHVQHRDHAHRFFQTRRFQNAAHRS